MAQLGPNHGVKGCQDILNTSTSTSYFVRQLRPQNAAELQERCHVLDPAIAIASFAHDAADAAADDARPTYHQLFQELQHPHDGGWGRWRTTL